MVKFVYFFVVYALATLFQLYHDGMYEMRRKKVEPTLLQTQASFNLPQHIGMVGEELGFDDAECFTQCRN